MLLKDKFILLCKIKNKKEAGEGESQMGNVTGWWGKRLVSKIFSLFLSLSFPLPPPLSLSFSPSLPTPLSLCKMRVRKWNFPFNINYIWQLWPFFVTLYGNLLRLLSFSKGYEKNALMRWDKEAFLEPVTVISFQNCAGQCSRSQFGPLLASLSYREPASTLHCLTG